MSAEFPSAIVSREAGTTLIELLVVLAILALLTAIAAPEMARYFQYGQVGAAKTEISTLSTGLHLYRADVGHYPSTEEGLSALLRAPAGAENWGGPYITNASGLNDPWGHPFIYRSPGERSAFDLYSLGPVARPHKSSKIRVRR